MTTPSRPPHPVIDCHVPDFDPVHFPYADGVWYRPSGAEIGTADQLGPGKEMLVDSGVRLLFDRLFGFD